MPKVDLLAAIVWGILSLLWFVTAGIAFTHRPCDRTTMRRVLFLACTFGLKSAENYHPLPYSIHNPYAWAFGVLLLFALIQYIQHVREQRKATQVRRDSSEESSAQRHKVS